MDSTLAPGLLIAAPTMNDSRFSRSVILLAEAGEEGALGFVLNRSTPYKFGDLADDIGFELAPEVIDNEVHYGGPVSPERGWILFQEPESDETKARENVLHVTSEIRLAATLEVLGEFVTAENTAPFKLLLGYAGWDAKQLEEEIQEGAWIPAELDPELLFGVPNDNLWESALDKLGLVAGTFFMGRSGGRA
jgi:putative transcriptional regulator